MKMTERRQTPRMKVEGLAYVTLDPDNGGIVSDISEGGLSFYSTTPVERTAKIRFWFSQRRYKVEGDGRMACTRFLEADSELAWTDETRRKGGLKFTNLAKEDREEIRYWISQHATPVSIEKQSVPSVPLSPDSPFASASWRDVIAKPRSLEALKVAPPQPKAPGPLTGFASGLAVGVLFSSIIAAGVLLHNHSREIGDSLIRLGERVGGGPRPQAPVLAAKPATVEANPISPQPTAPRPAQETEASAQFRFPEPVRLASPIEETKVKPPAIKLVASSEARPTALPAAKAKTSHTESTSSSTLLPSAPAIGAEPPADPSGGLLRPAVPQMELVRQPDLLVESSKEVNSGPPPEEYLEVGKFNDKLQADKTTDQLSEFGFPFLIVPKNLFWKKSYQVLAGPYGSDHEAEVAHSVLASHGFPARPFERGKREVTLHTAQLTLGRNSIPTGDCVIRWESYVPNAMVKIEGPHGATVVLEGKLVNREDKYRQTAVVYIKNSDGTRTLREFRFSGMRQALVFGPGDTSKRF